MSGQDGKIWYGLGIDNTQLQADANKSSRIFKGIGDTAVSEGQRMDSTFKKIAITAGSIFATQQALSFGKSMIQVRGEIESLQISFETLAGKAKGAALFGDIKDFAVNTPMMLQDLAKGAQTLLAFNIEAQNVMPILRQIGDISMGDAQKFNSLTLAFAQMSSTGKLMGQDLLQMINAGFNPLTIIAEKTGKTISVLKDEMSNGTISSQMVADAFAEATAEGGKFHGMLEKQSKGIQGSLSNLQGAVDDMFNDIGTKSQSFITAGIDGATTLVKNYEDIGRVLTVLIATYGAYRAALMATVVIQKAAVLSDNIKLVMMFRKELGLLTAAQQAFNIKAMANPYVLLATVIIGACAAIWQLVSAQKAETQAIEDAVKPMREEFTQTNLLIGKLKDANLAEEERKKILEELKTVNPEIVKGIDNEATAYEELSKRLEAYNKAKLSEIAIKKFSMQDDFDDAVTELTEANDALQSESASIIDVYSTLFTRFRELETQNKDIPADLKNLFTSIIDSSIPETEKVEAMFAAYDKITESLKTRRNQIGKGYASLGSSMQIGGADSGISSIKKEVELYGQLFNGLDLDDYKGALDDVSDATDEYEQKAKNLKTKIDNIAKSIYTDEKDRQDFIMSQWAIYFPAEVKQVETAIDEASTKTRTWKDDIKDLVSDEYKANIDAATNINDVITFIQKQIKAEQEKVDNMKPLLVKAGYDFTTMSFPAPMLPSAYDTQLQSEYNKSNNSLVGLNSAQKKLNIPKSDKSSGDAVTDKLKTQIDLIKSARDEYNKLLKVMSAEDAFKAIQGSTSYSKIQLKDIVSSDKDDDGYLNYLSGMVEKLSGRKTKEAKVLVAKLNEEIDSIKFQNAYDTKERESEVKKLNADYKKNVSEQVSQTQLDIRQSEIDAMDEGFTKELAVIGLNYDKLIAENQKRQEEWIKALAEQEKAKWLANNPDKGESQFNQTFDVSNLNADQQKALEAYLKIANDYRLQSEDKLTKDLLDKYKGYEQQRIDINKEFDVERKAIENSDRTQEEKTAAIIVLEKMRVEAVKAVNNEEAATLSKNSDLLAKVFMRGSDLTKLRLKESLAAVKQLMNYISGAAPDLPEGITPEVIEKLKQSPEELSKLYRQAADLQKDYDERTAFPFSNLINGFKSLKNARELDAKAAKESTKELKNAMLAEADLAKQRGMQMLADGAVMAADGISSVAEGLAELAKATGNAELGETAEMIGALGQNLSAAGKGAASGGWIGAIVGGATDMLTQFFESYIIAETEAAEFEQNRIDFTNAYQLAMLELTNEDYESAFGTKILEKAADASRKATEALEQYYAVLAQRTIPELKRELSSLGAIIFSGGLGGWDSTVTNESKALLEAYEKGYNDLQAMAIKTRDYSGWMNFWGQKDEYTSLKDLVPQLWGDDNSFNVDAAKIFLETNTQISDEQRKQIQNVIDLWDAYGELDDMLNETIRETFGYLGDSVVDSIVNAIKSGSNAWEDFRKSGSKALEALGEQMMYELFLATKFQQLQENLKEAYGLDSAEAIGNKQAEILASFFDSIKSDMDGGQAFLEEWKKKMEEQGFDVYKEDEDKREASKRGIATASQESVDENNGRLTAIQGHTFLIQGHTASIADNMKILVDRNSQILTRLTGIESNTAYCRKLEGVEKNIISMKNSLDEIQTKGLVLRK